MSNFPGTAGNDIFTGGVGADTAYGLAGNDSLSGSDSSDILVGGAGADLLDGGAGGDVLYSGDVAPAFSLPYSSLPYTLPVLDMGTEVDTLNGGDGSDRIFAGYGDNVDGGGGSDYSVGDYLYISFQGAPSGVTADFGLATQTIGGGIITGIEFVSSIQGSQFADNLNARELGGGYSDFTAVSGMDGNDTLTAGYYTGSLFGDAGDDVVDGRPSQYLFLVEGGDGNDTIYADYDNGASFASANGGAGDDTIYAAGLSHGGSGNDVIVGGLSYGDEGDDKISAYFYAGGDPTAGSIFVGGSGADTLTGSGGADDLVSADVIFPISYVSPAYSADDAGLEHDVLSGGDGNDALAIGYGDDADGGAGTDTLRLSLAGLTHGIDFDTSGIVAGTPFSLGGGVIQNIETLLFLRGSDFADTLRLQTQATQLTVDAGAGDDVIISNLSSVSVQGGAGDDRFVSGAAADTIDGGAGSDIVDYSNAAAGVTIVIGAGFGPGGDTLISVESAIGSAFNDTLAGDVNDNALDGGAGLDTVSYAAATTGVTVSLALQGQAQATAGGGADTLSHFENLTGSGYNDTLAGDANDNLLNGGVGADTASYAAAGAGVMVSLALQGQAQSTGGAGVDTLSNFENLTGSTFNDTLTGDAGGNTIDSAGGDDRLDGGAGVDTASYGSATVGVSVNLDLQGHAQSTAGAGADTLSNFENLTGSAFADTLAGDVNTNVLDGGAGVDTISYATGTAAVTVSLALQSQAQSTGGAGSDTLIHFENLTGSAFADVLAGDANNNLLDGGAGVDTVSYASAAAGVTVSLALQGQVQSTGGAGSDTLSHFENLTGSAYGDVLTGDAGNNVLNGGAGADTLNSGQGLDVLIGGGGNDHFVFGGDPWSTVHIADFEIGKDILDLSAFFARAGYTGSDPVADGYIAFASDGAGGTAISFDLHGASGADTGWSNTVIDLDHVSPAGLTWAQLITPAPPPPPPPPSGGGGGGGGGDPPVIATTTGGSLQGGAGADSLTGLSGDNTMFGGDGDDRIVGGFDFNQVNGNKGNDTITGKSRIGDWLLGGQGEDRIDASASSGHNILNGNIGDDVVAGGSGSDIVRGGQGDDVLTGGAGADWISGDRGSDTMVGGAGADTFHTFKGVGMDLVTDFKVSDGDRVQLDAGTVYTVNQVGADTVIDMGDGDWLVLQNVRQTTLPAGWIFGA